MGTLGVGTGVLELGELELGELELGELELGELESEFESDELEPGPPEIEPLEPEVFVSDFVPSFEPGVVVVVDSEGANGSATPAWPKRSKAGTRICDKSLSLRLLRSCCSSSPQRTSWLRLP